MLYTNDLLLLSFLLTFNVKISNQCFLLVHTTIVNLRRHYDKEINVFIGPSAGSYSCLKKRN